jgi:hypothetical protein
MLRLRDIASISSMGRVWVGIREMARPSGKPATREAHARRSGIANIEISLLTFDMREEQRLMN